MLWHGRRKKAGEEDGIKWEECWDKRGGEKGCLVGRGRAEKGMVVSESV
jgi:hypothetical protein